jgi:transcriptional regulator with XRE-family HTH domain
MGNVNAEDRVAMQRFGEKLRRLRMQRGMTVRELAVALGYSAKSNSYISETETGKRRPKIEFVLKVAQFFGVTMDQLTRDDMDLDAGGDFRANTDDTS